MKKTLLSCFLLLVMAVTANAQIVKGDMNDDKTVDITDVVSSVNVVLGNQPMEVISASDILDPYMVDNGKVIGTWYKSKTETVTFGEDGTTDYTCVQPSMSLCALSGSCDTLQLCRHSHRSIEYSQGY